MPVSGSRTELEHILDSIQTGVVVLDSALRILRISAGFRELFRMNETQADDFTQLTAQVAALADLLPAIQSAFSEGKPADTVLQLTQHRFVAVGLVPVPAAGDDAGKLFLTFRDITHETATEAKLVALVESTPDPFIIVEANGRIQRVNRQAEILFGYSRKELIGQSFKLLVPERFRPQHDAYTHNYQLKPVMR